MCSSYRGLNVYRLHMISVGHYNYFVMWGEVYETGRLKELCEALEEGD